MACLYVYLCKQGLGKQNGHRFMDAILHYILPFAVLAALIAYSQLAKRKNVPNLVYYTTLIAGGFLLMALLRV